MQIHKSLLFLAISGISTAAISAAAENTPAEPAVFVEKAAQGGMTEVELGRLALLKSRDETVREFAQRMVTDHGKANTELATIAKTKGLEPPKNLDAEHQAQVKTLRAKEGADFDRAYSEHMNMDHSKTISLFESGAKSGDAELAGFAAKTLPTLKEHKMMAKKLPAAADAKVSR